MAKLREKERKQIEKEKKEQEKIKKMESIRSSVFRGIIKQPILYEEAKANKRRKSVFAGKTKA